MASSVVVVEDDPEIGRAVVDALVADGYDAELFASGSVATGTLESDRPDLVLLDVGLPDLDGITLCRWVREVHPTLPIILLTARDSEIDVVVGLDAGASDYVTKPFSMPVLLARVRAHLRSSATEDGPFAVGSLSVDPAAYVARIDGAAVDLRPRELELLVLLGRNVGRVVSRAVILAEVWDQHWEGSSKTLDMHIMALRRKVGSAIEITTVRGVGYRLDAR